MHRIALLFLVIGLPLLAASPTQAQNSKTWVSGLGSDLSPNCSRLMPCKTFAAALALTNPRGEINCIDSGEFGPLSITQAVTISCEEVTAVVGGAPNQSGAITIVAGPADVVTLRGLDIEGRGTGDAGIVVVSAQTVLVEKCVIRNFRFESISAGIIVGQSTTTFLYVVDTVISDNNYGVSLYSTGGFKIASFKNVTITGSAADGLQLANTNVYANVNDSIISGNGGSAVNAAASGTVANVVRTTIANNVVAGLNASANGATIRISNNDIYNNTNGILLAAGATVQSDGTNKHGNSNGGVGPNVSLALQ